MKIDITPIIKEVRTKDDVETLHAGIEALEMNLYGAGAKSWNNTFDKILPERFSTYLRDSMVGFSLEQQLEITKVLLADLKKAISKFKPLKIDLAFEPTNEVIEQLNLWIDEKLGLEVVLDISYEKTLLGGARMIFGGRYGDFSAAKYFEDVLEREKENILKEVTGRTLSHK